MQNFWQNIWFNLTHITFKGRTSKKEYLYWFIFNILFSFATYIFVSLPAQIIQANLTKLSTIAQITATIYFFGAILFIIIFSIWKGLADITIVVRRFHDFGKSAWWSLLFFWLIAIVISIIVAFVAILITGGVLKMDKSPAIVLAVFSAQFTIILGCLYYLCLCLFKKGDEGENQYGLPSERV